MMRILRTIAVASLIVSGSPIFTPAVAAPAVDAQIVLAVDASYSIDEREYALQLAGIAAAVRDPDVLAAIRGGPAGRIAITLATWAEPRRPKDAAPWHLIGDRAGAERFARRVEIHHRRVSGGTGIGHAVMFCIRLFEDNGFAGNRRIIDVSGDGRETAPRDWNVTASQARATAIARGITVNGLVLLSEDADLAAYYAAHVIGGAGAFVMTAQTIEDFAAVFRRKLIREIEDRQIVSRLRPSADPAP